jgi:beta-lactamase regulating signal transducer with metallopeptidase domain
MTDVSSLSGNCLSFLLDISFKSLALGLMACLWLGIGRVRRPARRHAVWATVVCGMLGVPLLSLTMPGVMLPLLPSISRGKALATVGSMASGSTPAVAANRSRAGETAVGPEESIRRAELTAPAAGASEKAPVPRARLSWLDVAFLGYAIGVILLLGRLLVGLAGCRRIVRGSQVLAIEQITEGCSPSLERALADQRVEVRVCPIVLVPLTLGWLRPKILLPNDWTGWSPAKREAALAHELAHIERRDSLFVALAALNQCFYWFHPLAWLVPKRLAALSERACDDRAIALTGAPISYARHLLEFAASMVDHRSRVTLGVLSMADGGDLGTRMEAILDRNRVNSPPLTRQARLMLMALAVVLVSTVAMLRVGPRTQAAAVPTTEPLVKVPAKEIKQVTLTGRVLDPDGKPMAGAKLHIPYYSKAGYVTLQKAVSGPDGRFQFTIAESEFRDCTHENPLSVLWLAAVADGLGLGWLGYDVVTKGGELTLRLVRDVPIQGRVLDLQGKPVAGAKVRIYDFRALAGEDLSPYIAATRNGRMYDGPMRIWGMPIPGQPSDATTGADGRFRLAGIGRERVVRLEIEGPSIAHEVFSGITRDPKAVVEPLRLPQNGDRIYAATFDYVAAPSRPIQGIVRDQQTGKPVAGVKICGNFFAWANTDQAGRFELLGYPKSREYYLEVFPPPGEPFITVNFPLDDAPGLEPLTAEIPLVRGIPVRGQIIDAATRRPVKGQVEYHPLYPNPSVSKFGPKLTTPRSQTDVRADGTFVLGVLPGPGVLVFQAFGADYYETYMPATVDGEELKKIVKGGPDFDQRFLTIAAGGGAMSPLSLENYNAIALINPGEDAKALTIDLVPRPIPGRTDRGHHPGPGR